MQTGQLGKQGEELAAAHYIQKGYVVLERNYRTRQGELDLIVQKGTRLVFAEVKTRSGASFAAPREWVDEKKQSRIVAAAQQYLQQCQNKEPLCRFDVVEVLLCPGKPPEIVCIPNAFTL